MKKVVYFLMTFAMLSIVSCTSNQSEDSLLINDTDSIMNDEQQIVDSVCDTTVEFVDTL